MNDIFMNAFAPHFIHVFDLRFLHIQYLDTPNSKYACAISIARTVGLAYETYSASAIQLARTAKTGTRLFATCTREDIHVHANVGA